jgi:hypothetical protein
MIEIQETAERGWADRCCPGVALGGSMATVDAAMTSSGHANAKEQLQGQWAKGKHKKSINLREIPCIKSWLRQESLARRMIGAIQYDMKIAWAVLT